MMAKHWFKAFEWVLLISLLASCSSARVDANGKLAATLSRTKAPDGGLIVVHVRSEVEPSAVFEGIELPFYPVGSGNYEALLGVPFNHKPEKAQLQIHAGRDSLEVPVDIIDGGYRSETLRVSEKHVNPNKRELARILREQKEVGEIYKRITHEKLWQKSFSLPIDSVMTSPFGTKRVFNGQMHSFHQGLDLRAPSNTPIHAPAGGIVVLAKDLFFTGNTVLLDHGYGVFTIYAHMSKLEVKPGDRVTLGQVLGLSGMTGRASGPHLHWGAVIHHQKVNPMDLVEKLDSGDNSLK